MSGLVYAALSGQRRAMARLMSILEGDTERARKVIAELYPHTGQAHIVGVTGPPGSGKSTLISQIAVEYRRRDLTVGIVAVDPSSPFSGGAIMGDRIRMRALSGDSGVFIRSMASRGSAGGLAGGTANAVKLLDACGYRRIIVETMGAGQGEVDIARLAHTTIVIVVPGMGDDVQMLKAGILEIADILAVNKADLDGADRTVALLGAMMDLDPPHPAGDCLQVWRPSIIETIATTAQGAPDLVDTIERHVTYLHESGRIRLLARARVVAELRDILCEDLLARSLARIGQAVYEETIERLMARCTDPYAASRELLVNTPPGCPD